MSLFISIFFGTVGTTFGGITGAFIGIDIGSIVSIISLLGIFLSTLDGVIVGAITGRKKLEKNRVEEWDSG